MASELIQYLRLMIEAYLYDGAGQSDQEAVPYQIEATTVKDAFLEAMHALDQRMMRDQELGRLVKKATEDSAKQLNEAILLNSNELQYEDDRLLKESRNLFLPSAKLRGVTTFDQMLDVIKANRETDEEEAKEWGIDVAQLPRWKVLYNALIQDAEVVLLRYMLVRVAKCRKEELYRDMLKINNLHEDRRRGLKGIVREAFLCRVFGFDQAAAALCGAAVEAEVADRLESIGAIQKRDGKWSIDASSKEPLKPRDMLQVAHAKNLFDENDEANSAIYQKAERVVQLRNDALHAPARFSAALKNESNGDGFVVYTREVLEAVQERPRSSN